MNCCFCAGKTGNKILEVERPNHCSAKGLKAELALLSKDKTGSKEAEHREEESMKFSVKTWSKSNGTTARTGVFQLGNCPQIETPALLLSTRKGLPHFISPDLLPSLPLPDSSLLHVSPLHL